MGWKGLDCSERRCLGIPIECSGNGRCKEGECECDDGCVPSPSLFSPALLTQRALTQKNKYLASLTLSTFLISMSCALFCVRVTVASNVLISWVGVDCGEAACYGRVACSGNGACVNGTHQ